jgi:hypothetical protein
MHDDDWKRATYALSGAIAYREIEGELLVLTPDDDVLYTVNGSGRIAWDLLAQGVTGATLAAALASSYGVAEARVADDVRVFLDELVQREIVTRSA